MQERPNDVLTTLKICSPEQMRAFVVLQSCLVDAYLPLAFSGIGPWFRMKERQADWTRARILAGLVTLTLNAAKPCPKYSSWGSSELRDSSDLIDHPYLAGLAGYRGMHDWGVARADQKTRGVCCLEALLRHRWPGKFCYGLHLVDS